MARDRHNLIIFQGEDLTIEVTWTDDNGDPVDLTDYTAKAQVRTYYSAPDTELEFDTENGTIELDDGLITLTASAADTAGVNLPSQGGVWDLELTAADEKVTRLVFGTVKLNRQVTRA